MYSDAVERTVYMRSKNKNKALTPMWDHLIALLIPFHGGRSFENFDGSIVNSFWFGRHKVTVVSNEYCLKTHHESKQIDFDLLEQLYPVVFKFPPNSFEEENWSVVYGESYTDFKELILETIAIYEFAAKNGLWLVAYIA